MSKEEERLALLLSLTREEVLAVARYHDEQARRCLAWRLPYEARSRGARARKIRALAQRIESDG